MPYRNCKILSAFVVPYYGPSLILLRGPRDFVRVDFCAGFFESLVDKLLDLLSPHLPAQSRLDQFFGFLIGPFPGIQVFFHFDDVVSVIQYDRIVKSDYATMALLNLII